MFPFISNAYAQSSQVASGNSFMATLSSIAPLLLMFAAMFFLVLRPRMKELKAKQDLLNNVATGDEVVTASGILGKVLRVKDNYVELKIAKEVEVTVEKDSVAKVLPKGTVRF